MSIAETLKNKFFTDPDWEHVEKTIAEYITPLRDVLLIDTDKPAEDVKANVIARQTAYRNLDKFLQDTKVVNKPLSELKDIFK